MAESSNNITTVIRGISKFDGTPAKYLDWKRAVSAILRLTRPDIYEILDGAPCPQEKFEKLPGFERTAVEDTAHTPQRSDAGVDEQGQEDQDNQEQQLQEELQETAPGSPALDLAALFQRVGSAGGDAVSRQGLQKVIAAGGRLLLNEEEISKWRKDNAALFSVLYLTTIGAAGSILTKFEGKKAGENSDGQAAWQFMREKYENNSSQRRRILMRKLDNCRMEHGEDPDNFFSKVEYLIDDLAALNEPVTEHRKMDVILNGLTSDYSLVKFQAMKDSELSLEDLMTMMRNLYVNGLTRPGYTNHRGSAMYSDGTGMKIDKSRVKCHGCGKFGHFINDCHFRTAATGRGNPKKTNNTSSTKKTTARNRWCSFHKTTSHNDSHCYKFKQLGNNNTMKPYAGKYSKNNNSGQNGNAHTAMVQTHRRHGSDRRAQTDGHCANNTMKPSATRRNNGSDKNAQDAIYTIQSDDEEYNTGKHSLYTGSEYGYIPSEESNGFSFSTEAVQQARKEDAQRMRMEVMQNACKEDTLQARTTHQNSRYKTKV